MLGYQPIHGLQILFLATMRVVTSMDKHFTGHILDYVVWPGGKVMLKMINFSKSVKCLFQDKLSGAWQSACQTCIRSSFTESSQQISGAWQAAYKCVHVCQIHIWNHHKCNSFYNTCGSRQARAISMWLCESCCPTNGSQLPIYTRFPWKDAEF